MKKFLLIFFLVTLTPNLGFAIQGTCSWHGGVNCSAGADWDGSAICNDGWRDSSELYSDTASCKSQRHSCNTSEWLDLSSKYNLDEQQRKIDSILSNNYSNSKEFSSLSSFIAGQGAEDMRKKAIESIRASNEAIGLQNNLKADIARAQAECYALGDKAYYELLMSTYRQQNNITYSNNQNTKTGTSICSLGYVYSNGSCIDNSQICINQYGKNSYYDNGSCQCGSGYKMNYNKTQCVPSSESGCQVNASLVDSKCVCSTDSFSDGTNCIKLLTYCQLTYNTTVTPDGLSCVCPNNGVFNKQDRSCGAKLFPVLPNSTSTKAQINNYFSRSLRKGMSGDDVKQLQIMLQKLNYLPSTHVPSVYFGNVTSLALVKFQKDNRIQPATGNFGPSTQAKLISLTK